MKIQVDAARVRITMNFTREGSILAGTVEAGCEGVDVHLEVDSPEEPERVAKLLRNAEHGCYVMQSLRNPVPVSATFELNGQPLAVGV